MKNVVEKVVDKNFKNSSLVKSLMGRNYRCVFYLTCQHIVNKLLFDFA
jgi:hypothetical protein